VAVEPTGAQLVGLLVRRWGIIPELARRALALYRWARARGYRLRFTSGYRPEEAEERLFETLPSGQALAPGQSLHPRRRALDMIGDATTLEWLEETRPWTRFGLRGVVHQGTALHLHTEL